VGNKEEEAVLEITLLGPKLKFLTNLKIAITGANLQPLVNGSQIEMWQALDVKQGDILSFGSPKSGCRTYLAFRGGIDIPLIMESRSTQVLAKFGGLGRSLVKGDIICIKPFEESRSSIMPDFRFPSNLIPLYKKKWIVRVIAGPQTDYFTVRGINTFFSSEYEVTNQSNRMAYRLTGPRIELKKSADVISEATPPGSIQVPGNGMPIVLLADAQPTGGYPKIGVVITSDQNCFAQAKPGDKMKFKRISIVKSHKIFFEEEEKIQKIKSEVLLSNDRL
jgi:antagonist of KipI